MAKFTEYEKLYEEKVRPVESRREKEDFKMALVIFVIQVSLLVSVIYMYTNTDLLIIPAALIILMNFISLVSSMTLGEMKKIKDDSLREMSVILTVLTCILGIGMGIIFIVVWILSLAKRR